MIAGLCGTSSKASNYLCHHSGQKGYSLMWTMNFINMHCLQYHVISSGDVVCLVFGKPCLLYCCSLYICCSVIVNCLKPNNCWSLQFSQLKVSSRLRQSLLWTLYSNFHAWILIQTHQQLPSSGNNATGPSPTLLESVVRVHRISSGS